MTTQLLVIQDAETLELLAKRKCTRCQTDENHGQVWKKNQIIHILYSESYKMKQLWKFSSNSKDVRNLHKNFFIAFSPCYVTHIFKNDRKENISPSHDLFKM